MLVPGVAQASSNSCRHDDECDLRETGGAFAAYRGRRGEREEPSRPYAVDPYLAKSLERGLRRQITFHATKGSEEPYVSVSLMM